MEQNALLGSDGNAARSLLEDCGRAAFPQKPLRPLLDSSRTYLFSLTARTLSL